MIEIAPVILVFTCMGLLTCNYFTTGYNNYMIPIVFGIVVAIVGGYVLFGLHVNLFTESL